MKKTFKAWTFRPRTFASVTWTGAGIVPTPAFALVCVDAMDAYQPGAEKSEPFPVGIEAGEPFTLTPDAKGVGC